MERHAGSRPHGICLGRVRVVHLIFLRALQQKETLSDPVMTAAKLLVAVVTKAKASVFLLLGLGEAFYWPALHPDSSWGSRGK